MGFILQPWQLFFTILAGWVNRQQQESIEYLRTENQVLNDIASAAPKLAARLPRGVRLNPARFFVQHNWATLGHFRDLRESLALSGF